MHHYQNQRHGSSSPTSPNSTTLPGGVFVAIPKHQQRRNTLVGRPPRSPSSKLKSSLSGKFERAVKEAKRDGSYGEGTMTSSRSPSLSLRPKSVRFFPVPINRTEYIDDLRMGMDKMQQSPLPLHLYGVPE